MPKQRPGYLSNLSNIRTGATSIRQKAHLLLAEERAVLFDTPSISPAQQAVDHLLECEVAFCQFKTSLEGAMADHMLTKHRVHSTSVLLGYGPTSPRKSPFQVKNRYDPIRVLKDGSSRVKDRVLMNISQAPKLPSPQPPPTSARAGRSVPSICIPAHISSQLPMERHNGIHTNLTAGIHTVQQSPSLPTQSVYCAPGGATPDPPSHSEDPYSIPPPPS